jgi:hypothetical protein
MSPAPDNADALSAREPEMEAFLRRLAPSVGTAWQGASPAEIDEIQTYAGQELPGFYVWLLARVGQNAGPLPAVYRAFYARHVLTAYRSGEFFKDPPELFIARFDDPFMPLEIFYDLSQPQRNDALIDERETTGDVTSMTETLREWLAWASLNTMRINGAPQQCRGGFVLPEDQDVSAQLFPILNDIGFVRSVPGGQYCGVFERADAALSCKISAEAAKRHLLSYRLGGSDAGSMRRVLGEIATNTSIKVTAEEWQPPLPVT